MRPAATTGRVPRGSWTSPDGIVHIRDAGAGATFCGLEIGDTSARPREACEDCVHEAIADYARHHDCREDCGPELPQRSPGATFGRRVSWAGLIPIPEPRPDLGLMRRVRDALRRL